LGLVSACQTCLAHPFVRHFHLSCQLRNMSDKPKSMKLKFKGDKSRKKHKTRDAGEGSSSRKRKRDEDDEQHDLGQPSYCVPHTSTQTDLMGVIYLQTGCCLRTRSKSLDLHSSSTRRTRHSALRLTKQAAKSRSRQSHGRTKAAQSPGSSYRWSRRMSRTCGSARALRAARQ